MVCGQWTMTVGVQWTVTMGVQWTVTVHGQWTITVNESNCVNVANEPLHYYDQ